MLLQRRTQEQKWLTVLVLKKTGGWRAGGHAGGKVGGPGAGWIRRGSEPEAEANEMVTGFAEQAVAERQFFF